MFGEDQEKGAAPQRAGDSRAVAGGLTEMLAVLVIPALLLSGVSLFFG
jgi:hypothetical protein